MPKSIDEHFGLLANINSQMTYDELDIDSEDATVEEVLPEVPNYVYEAVTTFNDPVLGSTKALETGYLYGTTANDKIGNTETTAGSPSIDPSEAEMSEAHAPAQVTNALDRKTLQKQIRETTMGLLQTIVDNDILSEGEKASLLTQVYSKSAEILKERFGVEL